MLRMITREGPDAPKPDHDRPPAERVVSGAPLNSTWNGWEGENGRLYAGIWETEPGCWHVAYDEWEFCHIIAGLSVITAESGQSWRVGPGDAFVIEPGFKGTWEAVTTTAKHYVILLPEG